MRWILFLLVLLTSCTRVTEHLHCDLLIYGGTPAGMCAAEAAADEGMKVVILEPTGHLGGMMSSGLCASDKGASGVIGGRALEVFKRIGSFYSTNIVWRFEPHIAERMFDAMALHTNITLVPNVHIEKAVKQESRVTHILCSQRLAVYARAYIDASYEGDLMARAGIAYTVGRESRDTYGEPHAGVLPPPAEDQWEIPIKAREPKGQLRQEIQDDPMGKLGQDDHKIQAYNYRLCLTTNRQNQVKIKAPPGYDPERYLILGKYLKARPNTYASEIFRFLDLPNGKIDLNSRGPFSSDYIGGSWEYPDASYRKREKIKLDHKYYTQGLLYFLGHGERVPPRLQNIFQQFGYAKDEFAENDYWPYQLYVREGRRMIGDYVLTEHDVIKNRKKPDAVGMGSHYIEVHQIQRRETSKGLVQNRGGLRLRAEAKPYQIPYRCITPREEEASNVLVPVCHSASHVAYNSTRMEPQYMILGHAAGLAAVHALRSETSVQRINVQALQLQLRAQGQVLDAF